MSRPGSLLLLIIIVATRLELLSPSFAADVLLSTVQDVQFDRPAPYSSNAEFRRRLGYTLEAPAYDIAQETFRIVIPATYSTNQAWGLLVWISPGEHPDIPSSWSAVLARHHFLLVGANRAGNNRLPIERCRLALDAVSNTCRRYRIEPSRILVGGFSGGARIASVLGVCYADLFSGTLCICGVDFYQSVPGPTGGFYQGTYRPDAGILLRAMHQVRYVLVTGEADMNRDNTKSVAEFGFRSAGFKHVLYREVAGMGHALPESSELSAALDFLGGKTNERQKSGPL
jgi:predicted esterase